MRTIDALLQEVPAFGGLADEHLDLIAGCALNRDFAAGEHLLREGEPANEFFAIRHGTVALETFVPQRGAVTIETLHEGDLLGGPGSSPRTASSSTPARSASCARSPSTEHAFARSARRTLGSVSS